LLNHERYATSSARSKNRDELNGVLEAITQERPSEDWIKLLNDAGVPCGPVNSIDQTFADEQVQFLEMAQSVTSPKLGELSILGHPVSFNGKRNPLRKAAPELGEDTHAVLTDLGRSADEIVALENDGVI
jgi:crotonobetainyl-CoA:carnitine CoA-transferase CaiB-like acyl-CoA transferase